jgi:CMP-N,N'-diacetyllegionaminic acid synthase
VTPKILALIPARGGSKRVPGKNTKLLAGHPLIAWTILAARGSGVLDAVMVSTDDAQIKAVAEDHGISVPWLRPEELATDTASSMDVLFHSLDWYENMHGPVDGVMLLQPTSPFRSMKTIREAVSLFASDRSRPVIGFAPAPAPPEWCFRIRDGELVPVVDNPQRFARSQDLEPAFVISGAMYLASPDLLRSERTYFTSNACPLVVNDEAENLDIDTMHDWRAAQHLAESLELKPARY